MTVLRCGDMNVGVGIDRFLSTPFALRGLPRMTSTQMNEGKKYASKLVDREGKGLIPKNFVEVVYGRPWEAPMLLASFEQRTTTIE